MIYLASPFTHKSDDVMEARARAAMDYTARNIMAGTMIYSPVAHSYMMSGDYDIPWETWMRHCCLMLAKCAELWVLKLDGWQESEGIAVEIELAEKIGLPIKYVDPKEASHD